MKAAGSFATFGSFGQDPRDFEVADFSEALRNWRIYCRDKFESETEFSKYVTQIPIDLRQGWVASGFD